MKFRLFYSGQIRGNSRSKDHKNDLRLAFHTQLKRFWTVNKTLSQWKSDGSELLKTDQRFDELVPLKDVFARNYQLNGHCFVPLAIEKWSLNCEISVLLLVSPNSSHLFAKGDIDNKVKTLVDGLRMPQQKSELSDSLLVHDADNPLFTLMDDDDRLTKISVEYDTDFSANETEQKNDHVKTIISVNVYPAKVGIGTVNFL